MSITEQKASRSSILASQEAARQSHATKMREHGRMLDQTERCYREHNTPQARFEDEMREAQACADGMYDRMFD